MGLGDSFFHFFKVLGAVQVAHAAAIGAAETGLWLQSLANGPGNFAFQVKFGPRDDRFNEAAMGQEVVYVPASCLNLALG